MPTPDSLHFEMVAEQDFSLAGIERGDGAGRAATFAGLPRALRSSQTAYGGRIYFPRQPRSDRDDRIKPRKFHRL